MKRYCSGRNTDSFNETRTKQGHSYLCVPNGTLFNILEVGCHLGRSPNCPPYWGWYDYSTHNLLHVFFQTPGQNCSLCSSLWGYRHYRGTRPIWFHCEGTGAIEESCQYGFTVSVQALSRNQAYMVSLWVHRRYRGIRPICFPFGLLPLLFWGTVTSLNVPSISTTGKQYLHTESFVF